MPNPYAHIKFGLEVLSGLEVSIQEIIKNNHELYEYGLQGPDILFFHNRIFSDKLSRLGSKIHHAPFSNILTDNNIEIAYIYGLICHFVLDSICHSYINDITEKIKVSHGRIERAFDIFLLEADNISCKKYKPMNSFSITESLAYTLADFYKVNKKAIIRAMKNMKKCRIINYHNRKCIVTNNKLLELYSKAVGIATELINKYSDNSNETILNSTFSYWSCVLP